jgi:hypothetical protein
LHLLVRRLQRTGMVQAWRVGLSRLDRTDRSTLLPSSAKEELYIFLNKTLLARCRFDTLVLSYKLTVNSSSVRSVLQFCVVLNLTESKEICFNIGKFS